MTFFHELFLVSISGAFLHLDRTAAFQTMISRPVVAAPLIGFMLGDFETGIKAGMVLELLWIGYLPVGASVPPDETAVSILVAALSAWIKDSFLWSSESSIVLSMMLFIPVSMIAREIDLRIRKRNAISANDADRALIDFDMALLRRRCLSGLFRVFISSFFLFFVLLPAGGFFLYHLKPFIPVYVVSGAERVFWILPVVGLASLFTSLRIKGRYVMTSASLVFSLLLVYAWGEL